MNLKKCRIITVTGRDILDILTGIDIIEIERIKDSIESSGKIFVSKIFTENEINYCELRKQSKYQSYAVRFAAKEAVVKALGTGFSNGVEFKNIEILNNEQLKPYVVLHGRAKEVFCDIKGEKISISLSHCKTYAIANAVILSL